MSDPWDTMPEGLDGRVEAYLKKAAKLAITPDLVKKYALIVVAAEEVLLHRDEMLRATREEAIQVAALEHGIDEPDPKKARKAYSAARQGHQTIHTSAKSCAKNVSRFEIVLTRRYKSLQVDVAGRFPLNDLVAACKLIRDFAEATKPHPHDLGKVKFAKSPLSLTAAGHTFVWWRTNIADYEGRWRHMYQLARCWHLSDAKDVETFQRRVRKIKGESTSGGTIFLPCPPWAVS